MKTHQKFISIQTTKNVKYFLNSYLYHIDHISILWIKISKYPKNNKYKQGILPNLTKLERDICLLVQIEIPKYLWKGWKYPKNGYEIQEFATILNRICFLRI